MSIAKEEDALALMIGAGAVADFFARHYEREALIAPHNDPRRFADLLSIDAIDARIANHDLRAGDIDLANAANPVDRQKYVGSDGLVDRGVIAREYQLGSTIILQQLHEADEALAAFTRRVEDVFSCHVQTNVYLTPPSAQGFRTHYDNHDVFVLQVEGKKHWRLYDVPVSAPYRGEGFSPKTHPPGELKQEFTLEAGDCAYVPRGMMHDAQTAGDGPSLHITVGLIVKTWADLMLEAVSEVALAHPGFRQSLPPGFARNGFDRAAARAHFGTLAKAVASDAQMESAFDLMVDNYIRARAPDNRFAILDAPRAIAPTDRFALRDATPWRLADDGDNLLLIAPGGDLDCKPAERSAIERALSGAPFTQADLPEGGEADLLQRLLAFGLVARV